MPASATPAGPASAAQPEQNADARSQSSRPESGPARNASHSDAGGDRKPEREEGESHNPTDVSDSDLARHLNLPAGVAEQVKAQTAETEKSKAKPKAKEKGPAGEAEGEEEEDRGQKSEARGQEEEEAEGGAESEENGRPASEDHEQDQDHEHDGEDEEAEGIPHLIKGLDPKVRKKLEKRFGRLTRKNARLEEAFDRQEQELAQYRDQQGAQAQRAAEAAPQKGGILGSARTERDLDGMVSYAENLMELVDNNPDGVTIGAGDQAKFHPPEELARWKRDAEKVLLGSERRRRELREHSQLRQRYDTDARRDFPEVMKKDTPEYQTAVKLAGRYPWVCQLPEANYALGLMVEGFKALNGKSKTGKTPNAERRTPNGRNAGGEHDDLDERLTPEYQREHIPPTAPALPNKPAQRSPAGAGLNAKRAEKIAANFTRPNGATATNLASAFRALDDEEEESPSRRRVAV